MPHKERETPIEANSQISRTIQKSGDVLSNNGLYLCSMRSMCYLFLVRWWLRGVCVQQPFKCFVFR